MREWVRKISAVLVTASLVMFAFCWLVLFTDAIWFWSDVQTHSLVIALDKHELMSYNSEIGGHQAHLHDVTWLIVLVLSLLNGFSAGCLVKIYSSKGYAITWLSAVVLTIAVFYISAWTFYSFLHALERFAYIYFVPQG